MQHLIAWLLKRFTPFRVVAWDRGKIAGIGGPNPWLTVDKERIDQINAQMWAQQKMGKFDAAEAEMPRGVGANTETGQKGREILERKPWPLDRRQRVR